MQAEARSQEILIESKGLFDFSIPHYNETYRVRQVEGDAWAKREPPQLRKNHRRKQIILLALLPLRASYFLS